MEWYWAFALLLGMIVSLLALGFPVALAFVTTNILGWLYLHRLEPGMRCFRSSPIRPS